MIRLSQADFAPLATLCAGDTITPSN